MKCHPSGWSVPRTGCVPASLSFCSSSSSASFAVLTLPLLRSRAPWLVAATIPDMPAPPPALTTLSRGQQRRELYVILLTFPGFVFFPSISQSVNQSIFWFVLVRARIYCHCPVAWERCWSLQCVNCPCDQTLIGDPSFSLSAHPPWFSFSHKSINQAILLCVCVCYFPIAWERDQCLRMWSMYMSLRSTIGWWSMCLLASLLCGVIGGMISHSFEPCSCMSVYAWFIPFSFFLCKLLVAQSFSFLFKKNLNSKKMIPRGIFLLLRSMERSLMWKLHVDGGWDREQVYQT